MPTTANPPPLPAARAAFNADGFCTRHGLTPDAAGRCAHCATGGPALVPAPLSSIEQAWARDTTSRMLHGDLRTAKVVR